MKHSSTAFGDPNLLFDVLADSRRRRLIALLREHEQADRLFLDTLSARLAEDANESADDVAVALHHHHLPKLDAAGLVDYDPTVRMVEFTGLDDERFANDLPVATSD